MGFIDELRAEGKRYQDLANKCYELANELEGKGEAGKSNTGGVHASNRVGRGTNKRRVAIYLYEHRQETGAGASEIARELSKNGKAITATGVEQACSQKHEEKDLFIKDETKWKLTSFGLEMAPKWLAEGVDDQ